MTSETIRECLAQKWPDTEYLSIAEAPQASDRGGRKIDLLVLSLWRSRGLSLDAVEIKVSMSDWARERDHAEKADFWWRHANRFWLACPVDMTAKVLEQLPITWGLIACDPSAKTKAKVVKQPNGKEADAMPWSTTVGVMRAAADAGLNAIRRAERRGRDEGLRAAQEKLGRGSPDAIAKAALEALQKKVADFEKASGISIAQGWNVTPIGEVVGMLMREHHNPGHLIKSVVQEFDQAARHAEGIAKEARRAQQFAKSICDAALSIKPALEEVA